MAGAFDRVAPPGGRPARRSQMLEALDKILDDAQKLQRHRQAGQISLFDLGVAGPGTGRRGAAAGHPGVPAPAAAGDGEGGPGVLRVGPPLRQYQAALAAHGCLPVAALPEQRDGARVAVGGMRGRAEAGDHPVRRQHGLPDAGGPDRPAGGGALPAGAAGLRPGASGGAAAAGAGPAAGAGGRGEAAGRRGDPAPGRRKAPAASAAGGGSGGAGGGAEGRAGAWPRSGPAAGAGAGEPAREPVRELAREPGRGAAREPMRVPERALRGARPRTRSAAGAAPPAGERWARPAPSRPWRRSRSACTCGSRAGPGFAADAQGGAGPPRPSGADAGCGSRWSRRASGSRCTSTCG